MLDGGLAWEGTRHIWALKLASSVHPDPKPGLFLVAGQHPRDIATTEMLLRLVTYLAQSYGLDPDVTWLLDNRTVTVVPAANPDGYYSVYNDGYNQVKNRDNRYCPNSISRGADLNRNYPFEWDFVEGTIPQCDSAYPGPSALSEPESSAVLSLFQASGANLLINLQGPDPQPGILFPWGYTPTPPPDAEGLFALGWAFGRLNGTPSSEVRTEHSHFPISGIIDDSAYGLYGVPAYTWNIGMTTSPICADLDPLWSAQRPALIYAAKAASLSLPSTLGHAYGPDVTAIAATPAGTSAITLTAVLSSNIGTLAGAVYVIDDPGSDGSGTPIPGSYGGGMATITTTVDTSGLPVGRHLVLMQGENDGGHWGVFSSAFFTVTVTQATSTPTATRTGTPPASGTTTATPSGTLTPLPATNTGTPTHTVTATRTDTATPSPTITVNAGTNTATRTPTVTTVINPTHTATGSPTPAATITETPSSTTIPTETSTRTPTSTRTATDTRTPTDTRTATDTRTPTDTRTATDIPSPTGARSPTNTRTPTYTRAPTDTHTPTNTRTPAGTSSPAGTRTATLTGVPASTSTSTGTPAGTSRPTDTRTATFTRTPAPPNTLTPLPCITFTDVHPSQYFFHAVDWLFCRGIISGYPDNTFRPNNGATRAQIVKMIVLGESWPIYTPPGPTFSDVAPSDWHFPYVETAVHHAIISGYPDRTFRPNNPVTRAQLSKMVVLARLWPLLDPATPSFVDVPPGSAFYTYVETARSHALVSGYGDGTFRPYINALRGELSKILYVALTQAPLSACRGPQY
jgi:hypothetical protein